MTVSILCVTTFAKFDEGGWITVVITGAVIATCIGIRRHYQDTKRRIRAVDAVFANTPNGTETEYPELDPESRPRSSSSAARAAAACMRCCGCSGCSRATSATSSS